MFRSKDEVREYVWNEIVKRGVARPPYPVRGRIPNFEGAEQAARKLAETQEFRNAKVVFVSPDSPQKPVREIVLKTGKTLVMATPRLRQGFVVIERVPPTQAHRAATIAGAFRYGKVVECVPYNIDLMVLGSVAVAVTGWRIGKGGGFGDLEYLILRKMGKVTEETPIATTVHDIQVFEDLPHEEGDVPVDIIATPTRVIRVEPRKPKPRDVDLAKLGDRIREIPVLWKLVRGELSC